MNSLSPATKKITLQELADLYEMSIDEVQSYLKFLGVPVFNRSGIDEPHSFVLACAVEVAELAALLPRPVTFTTYPNATTAGASIIRQTGSLAAWRQFKSDPLKVQMFMSLVALMYGSQDEKEFRQRIWSYGDAILKKMTDPPKSTRGGPPGRKLTLTKKVAKMSRTETERE